MRITMPPPFSKRLPVKQVKKLLAVPRKELLTII
jgi:hypothetical protein